MAKLGWCLTGHHGTDPPTKGTCPGNAPGILGRPIARCSCECHDPATAPPPTTTAPPPPATGEQPELYDEEGCLRQRRSTA